MFLGIGTSYHGGDAKCVCVVPSKASIQRKYSNSFVQTEGMGFQPDDVGDLLTM
jgi:hypothetical protein